MRKGLKTTALNAVPAANSSRRNENRARTFNFLLTPQAAAEYFCSLYRQRVGYICKLSGRKRWQTWKGKLEDFQILAVIADGGRGGIFRGCHWADETRFAVLDIDARSQYHNQENLAELSAAVENVGLKINLYQSSDSGGWHLYIPLAGWQKSPEVEHTFKRWLKALGYEIKGGQLEVFPCGNALRLPLQPGFAWLAPDASVIRRREEITVSEALACFLEDLEENAQNWQFAKDLMESQISAADRAAGREDQAHQKRLGMDGFDDFFNYTRISEHCEKARQYLVSGLTEPGTRHEALFTIQHLLWHGDQWLRVPKLAGRKNAAKRYRFLREWIEQNHNGQCSHINQGDWRTIEGHISRLVNWQRSDLPKLSDYERYRRTERAEERQIELLIATGQIWDMEGFEKANDKREVEARTKIAQGVAELRASGEKVTGRRLNKLTGCSRNTIKKHKDLLLPSGSSVLIRGGTRGQALGLAAPSSEFEEEEKKESSDPEIESSSGTGCVLDSLRYDRTGQTATNSRQVATEVLAAVHPIQSNSGVKHELAGFAPCVASGGIACGINGSLPTASQQVPSIYSSAFFSMGAPAQNLRQVGDRVGGLTYKQDTGTSLELWIKATAQVQQVDRSITLVLPLERAFGYVPLSCYDKRRQRAGGRLLSPNGYIALGSEAHAMGNESHEKSEQERPAERQTEHVKRAQGEVTNAAESYTEQVKAHRIEKKLSGNSGATGQLPDKDGKGLASAKDLLGDDAHGLSKKEKQAALLAQIERDGYIVGKAQDKPVLVAEKLENDKPKTPEHREKLKPQDGKDYSLKQILNDYKTPFIDAYEHSKQLKDGESGKSKTLEQVVDRIKSCPWADRIRIKFDSHVGNPEYDPVASTITIRPQDSPADQIELFVHEGFHSTHQDLKEMYMGDKPLEPKQYAEVLGSLEAKSFEAEIRVHNELTAKMGAGAVTYEWRDSNNKTQPTKNLGELYAEKGLDGLKHFVLDQAFTDMKLDGTSHSWNYRTYYEATQPKYAALWKSSHDELHKRLQQNPKLKAAIEDGGF